LPAFATELAYGRRTYNCRSETVATLASFKHAWAGGQRCIIPCEAFYEPNWETGKSVRWRISQPSDIPMGIAGIYRRWKNPAGGHLFTFSMLTVNAEGHPVMKRFHRPGDEKRMVVILDPAEYLTWLTCPVDEAARFFKQWMGALDAVAAPLARGVKTGGPPKPQDELF
jgi:putative SOS response-associated peptidase YedK